MINRLGLPNIGALAVRRKMLSFGEPILPITVNVAPSPDSKHTASQRIEDLTRSIRLLRDTPGVDCFEINISCPNTDTEHDSQENIADKRKEYQKDLWSILDALHGELRAGQRLSVKISPDMTLEEFNVVVQTCLGFSVGEVVACNTTTEPGEWFDNAPFQKGGLSGKAVYEVSLHSQERLVAQKNESFHITACGGLDNVEKIRTIWDMGIRRMQLYTPLIFRGPSLLVDINNFVRQHIDFQGQDKRI